MGGMVGILTVLIVSVFGLSVINQYLLRSTSLAAVISLALVDLTNTDRTTNDIGGLTVSPILTAAAQAKADDMAAKGYFAHVSPDGKDSWYWFKQSKYPFTYAGENLAVDFSDSLDVERAWMNSPAHRANILNGHFTEIGIAVAHGVYQDHPTTFAVQMFGTPAPTETPLSVRTLSSSAEASVPAFATTKGTTPTVTKVAVATTATNLVLGVEKTNVATPPSARWWQQFLASPKTMLRYAYYVFAGVILLLLAFVTELEFHKRHLRHVGAAAFLFLLMIGLFVLANSVIFAAPVLAAT